MARMSRILDELKALYAASQEERARLAQVTADAGSLRAEKAVLEQRCQSLVRFNSGPVSSFPLHQRQQQ